MSNQPSNRPSDDLTSKGKPRRNFFRIAFGGGMAMLSGAAALWAAGTARFLMPNVVAEPPERFTVGYPGDYPPGRVETRFKEDFGIWVVHMGSMGGSRRFMRCGRYARTWGASRSGRSQKGNSSAPATEAGSIWTGSTSKVRRRVRWSVMRSVLPRTGNLKWTAVGFFRKSWASGRMGTATWWVNSSSVRNRKSEPRNPKQMRMFQIRICQTELRATPDGLW